MEHGATAVSRQEMTRTWTRNGGNCTDLKCILEEDTGLTNELDVKGEGKRAIKNDILGFWLKQLDRDGVI